MLIHRAVGAGCPLGSHGVSELLHLEKREHLGSQKLRERLLRLLGRGSWPRHFLCFFTLSRLVLTCEVGGTPPPTGGGYGKSYVKVLCKAEVFRDGGVPMLACL